VYWERFPEQPPPHEVLDGQAGESGPLRATESPRPGRVGVIGTGSRAGSRIVLMDRTVGRSTDADCQTTTHQICQAIIDNQWSSGID